MTPTAPNPRPSEEPWHGHTWKRGSADSDGMRTWTCLRCYASCRIDFVPSAGPCVPTAPNPRPSEEHEQDIERRTMPIEKMVAMMLRVYGREAWEAAWGVDEDHYVPCCVMMQEHLHTHCDEHPNPYECPDSVLVSTSYGFALPIHDGGSSGIEILYCPWCGARLAATAMTRSPNPRPIESPCPCLWDTHPCTGELYMVAPVLACRTHRAEWLAYARSQPPPTTTNA